MLYGMAGVENLICFLIVWGFPLPTPAKVLLIVPYWSPIPKLAPVYHLHKLLVAIYFKSSFHHC